MDFPHVCIFPVQFFYMYDDINMLESVSGLGLQVEVFEWRRLIVTRREEAAVKSFPPPPLSSGNK